MAMSALLLVEDGASGLERDLGVLAEDVRSVRSY